MTSRTNLQTALVNLLLGEMVRGDQTSPVASRSTWQESNPHLKPTRTVATNVTARQEDPYIRIQTGVVVYIVPEKEKQGKRKSKPQDPNLKQRNKQREDIKAKVSQNPYWSSMKFK